MAAAEAAASVPAGPGMPMWSNPLRKVATPATPPDTMIDAGRLAVRGSIFDVAMATADETTARQLREWSTAAKGGRSMSVRDLQAAARATVTLKSRARVYLCFLFVAMLVCAMMMGLMVAALRMTKDTFVDSGTSSLVGGGGRTLRTATASTLTTVPITAVATLAPAVLMSLTSLTVMDTAGTLRHYAVSGYDVVPEAWPQPEYTIIYTARGDAVHVTRTTAYVIRPDGGEVALDIAHSSASGSPSDGRRALAAGSEVSDGVALGGVGLPPDLLPAINPRDYDVVPQ